MGIYLPASNNTPYVDIGEWGSPTNPIANVGRIYVYDDSGTTSLAFRDSNGLVTLLNPGDVTAEPTGFPNRTDSTLSFVHSTRTFTIAPTVTSFDYYYKGRKTTVSAAQNVVIDDTNGLHYIYYNSSGTLVSSTSFWDLETTIPIALVVWNTDMDSGTGVGIIAEERHGIVMDWATHRHMHLSFGTQYHNGLGMSGYTLITDTDAAVQFGISNGEIQDEDIPIEITHSAAPTDPFEQVLTDPAEIPVWYRVGASGIWTWDTATTFAFKNTAASRVNYNNWTGATWEQQIATDNYYVAYWIVATNAHDEPIISMQGQREDSSLTDARTNNTIDSIDFGSLPFAEMRVMYRVIIRTKNSYGGTRLARIYDVTDFRASGSSVGSSYVPVYHGSLDGLANDDHPQYALLAGRTGGQSLNGGVDASDNLTLDSTSNATKGLINVNSAFAFDTSLSAPSHSEGQVYWDSNDHSLALQTDVTNVTLQVGQEIFVRARNNSGVTINDGEVVYVTGAAGNRPTVAKAKSDSESTAESLGVATASISHQSDGYITVFGYVRDIDLGSYNDGDPLYLSDSVAGGLTDTPPSDSSYVIKVGTVLLANVSGILLVDPRIEKTNTASLSHLRIHDRIEGQDSSGYLALTDAKNGDSSWSQEYVTLSESGTEWNNYSTSFGEVSLMNAIYQAGKNSYFSTSLSNQTADGDKIKVTTTPAVTFGQSLLLDSSSLAILADADALATMPCRALAIDTGSGADKEILLRGVMRDDTWSWTPGDQLFVSANSGGLTQTAPSTTGQYVQPVGFAITSTVIYFNPSETYIKVA